MPSRPVRSVDGGDVEGEAVPHVSESESEMVMCSCLRCSGVSSLSRRVEGSQWGSDGLREARSREP